MSAAPATAIHPAVEPLGFPDHAGLLALSRSVGWPHTDRDWWVILASGIVYGVRDADGEAVAACAALFPYGPDMSVLGMVMVRPDAQRRGLGEAVVGACLAASPHDGTPIYLATTPAGEGLYRRLGFRQVGGLVKAMADGPLAPEGVALPAGWRLSPQIAMGDLVRMIRLDQRACGGLRDGFLKHRLNQADARATLFDAEGGLVGYGFAVGQGALRVLGPIAAADDDGAAALAAHLAAGHDGPLRIDIPDGRTGLWRRLEALGLRAVDLPPILALGADALPADGWNRYAAIAAQAFL